MRHEDPRNADPQTRRLAQVILVCMRIIRRINDDLSALIARVRRALAPRKKFRTTVHSCGKCYLANLDNTAEVLAVAEGEHFK